MIFLRGVFNRKKFANERVKRDEWAQKCGDASLLNAKHYNGTFAAIDFGSSVAIMSALHVRSDPGREYTVLLTVLELVLLDEILRRVVDAMVWFDGSDDRRIAHHSCGRISRLGVKRGSDHVRRKECHRHCILEMGGIVPVRTSSPDHKLTSSSADDAIFWRSGCSYISPASVQCPMKKGEWEREMEEKEEQEEKEDFNAFPKSYTHFYSDAFGSYTIRRQSEKQANSSGTEIRDHDNDSTRRPSVPGDNETRETAHTPTIEPR
ncbi:hypothetical protein ALC60_14147 [Trachymyrmex zeteki]|uniref:Uncharacterized protein n=1 Tax=Mycetomoellerius zeteki TaxID=64791 RepID=A0A151WG89_9HYME|nr:hypothetical protein ALC60_14147 [Trachymyrmex zeteki]